MATRRAASATAVAVQTAPAEARGAPPDDVAAIWIPSLTAEPPRRRVAHRPKDLIVMPVP